MGFVFISIEEVDDVPRSNSNLADDGAGIPCSVLERIPGRCSSLKPGIPGLRYSEMRSGLFSIVVTGFRSSLEAVFCAIAFFPRRIEFRESFGSVTPIKDERASSSRCSCELRQRCVTSLTMFKHDVAV